MEIDENDKLSKISSLLSERNLYELKAYLTGHPAEIADLISELDTSDRVIIFRLLHKDNAVRVFEHLDPEVQSEILGGFHDEKIIAMVNDMSPDDRTRLLDELPALVVKKLLERMSPEKRKAAFFLLGYQEDTAGRIMTPEFVDLRVNMTAEQALERIKKIGNDSETIYYLYVIDDTRHLLGVVSLKSIVLADKNTRIGNLMDEEVIKASTEDDQEKVARMIMDYDLLAVPVVDRENRLVGIITVDDVMDIIEEETTEDMLKMGSVEVSEKGYFKSSVFENFRKRIGWMILLLALNSLTGNIILGQKAIIEGIVILAAFIPILIGSGGNAGAQSSTVVIRGLAIGEIEVRHAAKIILRELGIGLGIGLLLGLIATIWAYWMQGDLNVSLVVGTSFIFVITVATTIGALLPMLVKKIGLDPALIATPFITTTIDVTALLIYFRIARHLLGL